MPHPVIMMLFIPSCVLFVIFLPLALSFILLKVFRHIGRRVAVKLSYLEVILTIASALIILGIIVYVSNHDNVLLAWLYQNPGIYLSWRFAIAFLVGVPISIAIRKYPESQPGIRSKPRSKIILFSLLILFIGILLLPPVFFSFAQQLIFGYLQSMRYNPWQIALPILFAIGLHFYFLKSLLVKSTQYRRILFSTTLIVWIIGVLFLSTATILYLKPNRYHYSNPNWQVDYLSEKYATTITYEKLHENPQSLKIALDLPVTSSIAFKYLTFGEKAVDCSALND
jgi:hypothetical protein